MPGAAEGHEHALAVQGTRKGLGAYYTPPDVVAGLLDLVLEPVLDRARAAGGIHAMSALRVLDPACGTGNFLVAAAQRIAAALVRAGMGEAEAAGRSVRCVRGIEVDPSTARLCRANLRALHPSGGGRTIICGDALLQADLVSAGAFDVVVGNPPFLSQLASSTARSRAEAGLLRARFGDVVGPYTDPAAAFLLVARDAVRPAGGVVCLIQPLSFLSARDAQGVRAEVLADAAITVLWVAEHQVFDADVEVCAPVLVRGSDGPDTLLVRGRTFATGATAGAPGAAVRSWSSLLADAQDLPQRTLQTKGVLGDMATATADFRDQYYGLAPAMVDDRNGGADQPPLITSGLIDPARVHWGERLCRFNKTSYRHPRVDVARLSPPLQAWARRRLVPKVLVATQTRVLEAIVDADGVLLPSVPVITVAVPDGSIEDLWRIAALMSAPAVTLEAARRHLGAARNASALRLSASDLLALPLPADRVAWDQAARVLADAPKTLAFDEHRALLRNCAALMNQAFGCADDAALLTWWESRLPRPPRP